MQQRHTIRESDKGSVDGSYQNFLVFESSCDDTSVAVLRAKSGDARPELLGMSVQTQDEVHSKYGGVVPELASRAHLQNIIPCLEKALDDSGLKLEDINIFAATSHPGLVGSLLIGHTAAKSLALLFDKIFISCNHLDGHLASLLIENDIEFPCLALVVSGGHTSLYLMKSEAERELLGLTLDDAAGEAFDKGAKLLGLSFPGGAELEKLAASVESSDISFPTVKVSDLNFSFSGLKTQLTRVIKKEEPTRFPEIAKSYQKAIINHIESRLRGALDRYDCTSLGIVGGVARNLELRSMVSRLKADGLVKHFYAPSPRYCTDNAAMIGIEAFLKWKRSELSNLFEDDVGSTFRPKRQSKRRNAS